LSHDLAIHEASLRIKRFVLKRREEGVALSRAFLKEKGKGGRTHRYELVAVGRGLRGSP